MFQRDGNSGKVGFALHQDMRKLQLPSIPPLPDKLANIAGYQEMREYQKALETWREDAITSNEQFIRIVTMELVKEYMWKYGNEFIKQFNSVAIAQSPGWDNSVLSPVGTYDWISRNNSFIGIGSVLGTTNTQVAIKVTCAPSFCWLNFEPPGSSPTTINGKQYYSTPRSDGVLMHWNSTHSRNVIYDVGGVTKATLEFWNPIYGWNDVVSGCYPDSQLETLFFVGQITSSAYQKTGYTYNGLDLYEGWMDLNAQGGRWIPARSQGGVLRLDSMAANVDASFGEMP